jgi:hypothetical protein
VLIEDCDVLDFHLGLPCIQYVDLRQFTDAAKRRLLQAFEPLGPKASPPSSGPARPLSGTPAVLPSPRSHFHCGPWVPAEFFIGREAELAEARGLIDSRQSFLIIGHPRAGKTSLCQKLKKEFEGDAQSDVLVSYLNLHQCSQLTIETFLEHTILNIVGEIARKAFGCRYTDLKRPSPVDVYPQLRDDALFHSFVDIFRHVSERTHEQPGLRPTPLVAQDFVHLTTDLLQIAAEKGRGKFLIFYDEANRLPLDISGSLLLSIGETLGETGVVGGYVASPEMEERFEELDQLFGGRLIVGPFQSPHEMKRLLAKYYFGDGSRSGELPVTERALQMLWSLSRGEPFLIQLIADWSFKIARQQGSDSVDTPHTEQAHAAVRKERPKAFRQ